ncbi:TetR family transcriptional regulator [Xinfangfangia sp. CPCC 101601]|uniref:TetR family transcriptional regulator n=1 Tax=Pseudogemmobacter lacusdianii TaxID=3069608 RepID=A0ABU0VW72_9RHOB|nr:TetR family transcriptional regulator [Xinfangfangia sp. CPCC 101601]MDQ2066006.1 TetR family transcriptional regulator [Xinfangfangia sp. CPCC 101601]
MRRSKDDAEKTRMSILLAAEDLFSRQGVANTSLDQIARKAGVTRGAIYWHFKDKTEVLQALRVKFRPPQDELTEQALAVSTEDVFVVFERSALAFLTLFASDQSRQRIYKILSTLPVDASDPESMEAWNVMLHLAKRADATGILSEDLAPEEAALMLASLLNGLLNQWLNTKGAFDLAEVGAKILQRMLRTMRK